MTATHFERLREYINRLLLSTVCETEHELGIDDLRIIETENRPGYYKDSYGRWRRDRRVISERRKTAKAKSVYKAMRKRVRRKVDRQALNYIRGNKG